MTPVASTARAWLNAGLGLVYPEVCQLCGGQRATVHDGFVCAKCWSHVRFIRAPFCARCGLPYPGDLTTPFECTNCREMELHFSSARSAVIAKTVVLEAIHRYKYQRALWFENFLADLLIREAAPVLRGQGWDFIVPVPLHPLKFRERDNLPFGKSWNTAKVGIEKSFANWVETLPGLQVGAGLELPYATSSGEEVNADTARAFGRTLAAAIRAYLSALSHPK